jgi:hypothetical protein
MALISRPPKPTTRIVLAVSTVLAASALLAGPVSARSSALGRTQPKGGPERGKRADAVVFSFATVGDSRQDPVTFDQTTALAIGELGAPGKPAAPGKPSLTGSLLPQDAHWLQNTKAITRILRGIQQQRPNLLFFNGDMIYGYGRPALPPQLGSITSVPQLAQTDAVIQYVQYAFWRGLVSPLFESGTYVVPVPGNHETQCNSKDTTNQPKNCASGKKAYVDNEQAYLANMGDLIEDIATNERFQNVSGFGAMPINGFTAATAVLSGGNNGVLDTPNVGTSNEQETELSYSFDIRVEAGHRPVLLHFVIVNTDPAGADATAPSDWMAADLQAAKQRAAAAHATPHYFVFGHKQAFTYAYDLARSAGPDEARVAGGLDANLKADPSTQLVTDGVTINNVSGSYRDAFWAVIAHYNATYFCGHQHILHVERFADPTGTSKNSPYQVQVGAGGSPFDEPLAPGNAEPLPLRHPWDRFYGWARVQVHRSGAVSMTVQGFSDGAAYDPGTGVIGKLGVERPVQVLYSIEHLQ